MSAAAGDERQRSKRGALARNAGWSYVAAVATLAAGLGNLALAAHVVGARSLSTFLVLDAVVALLQAFSFGLSVTALNAQSERAGESEAWRAARALRALSLLGAVPVLLAPILLVALGFADERGDTTVLALLLGLGGAITVATSVDQGLITERSDYRRMASLEAGGAVAAVALAAVAVPGWGLVGLAVARVINTGIARGGLFVTTARRDVTACGVARPQATDWARVRQQSAPLFVVTVGVQIVTLTDTVVLRAVVGPVAVTTYRLASSVPSQIASWVFRGFDVILPRLTGPVPVTDQQLALLGRSSRLFCAASAIGLTTTAVLSASLLQLVAGADLAQGPAVMVLFCLLWLINVVVHGPVLLLMATGQQAVLTRIVLAEVVANVVLTASVAPWAGLLGVVAATLLAVVVSNLVFLPPAIAARLGVSARALFLPGIKASAVSCAAVAVVASPLVVVASRGG